MGRYHDAPGLILLPSPKPLTISPWFVPTLHVVLAQCMHGAHAVQVLPR